MEIKKTDNLPGNQPKVIDDSDVQRLQAIADVERQSNGRITALSSLTVNALAGVSFEAFSRLSELESLGLVQSADKSDNAHPIVGENSGGLFSLTSSGRVLLNAQKKVEESSE